VKRIIGHGSSNMLTGYVKDVTRRAPKLQIPIAVAANRVGKKNEFAVKFMLKVHEIPNFARRKNTKNTGESWCLRPQLSIMIPPIAEMANEMIKLSLGPILS